MPASPDGVPVKAYVVGGAVRDGLLGLPVQDRDWVVVGATPEEMTARGFKPVGRDFPVFLHPDSREEYALARTERKSGRGYHGFTVHAAPTVTLEEDLARRDLTINAMALGDDGTLIDPYGGADDLRRRVLRHVGPAFAEDPVRVLRLARFAARFPAFTVAPQTLELMRGMVEAGELDFLVAERVWQELSRGLMEARPSRQFVVLRACGALARVLPELDRLFGVPQPEAWHGEIDTGLHTLMTLDAAAAANAGLTVRFGLLVHDLGKGTTPSAEWPRHIGHEARGAALAEAVAQRLRVPTACRELGVLAARFHTRVHTAPVMRPGTLVELLERTDALRRPARFLELLEVAALDQAGRAGPQHAAAAGGARLRVALEAVRTVDAGAVARSVPPAAIRDALHRARTAAVTRALAGAA